MSVEDDVKELKGVVLELLNIVETKTQREVSNIFDTRSELQNILRGSIFERKKIGSIEGKFKVIDLQLKEIYENIGGVIENAIDKDPTILSQAIDNAVNNQISNSTTQIDTLTQNLNTESITRFNKDTELKSDINVITTEIGTNNVANKLVRLNLNGKIDESLLNTKLYDDVIEGVLGLFPVENGKIYIDTNTKKVYHFDGTQHIELANTIKSINSKTGDVLINADDIDDAITLHKFTTQENNDKIGQYLTTFNNNNQLVKLENGMIPQSLYTTAPQNINLTTDDVIESATKKYISTGEKQNISNYLVTFNTSNKLVQLNNVGKIPNTLLNSVTSVNSSTGDVILTTDNVNEGINNKYVSTAQKTDLSILGVYNQAQRLVQLDNLNKIPTALYDGANAVIQYTTLANLPATGDITKFYYITNDKKHYRWTGDEYVVISQGEPNGTALIEPSLTSYAARASGGGFIGSAIDGGTSTVSSFRMNPFLQGGGTLSYLFQDATTYKGIILDKPIILQINLAQSRRFRFARFNGAEVATALNNPAEVYEIDESGVLRSSLAGATGSVIPKVNDVNPKLYTRVTMYFDAQSKLFRMWGDTILIHSVHGNNGQTIPNYTYNSRIDGFFTNVNSGNRGITFGVLNSVDNSANYVEFFSLNSSYTYLKTLTFADPTMSPVTLLERGVDGIRYVNMQPTLENSNPTAQSVNVDLSNYYTKAQSDLQYVSVNTSALTNYRTTTSSDSTYAANSNLTANYPTNTTLTTNHYTKAQTDNINTLTNYYNRTTSDSRYTQPNTSVNFTSVNATTITPTTLVTNNINSNPSGNNININGVLMPTQLSTASITSATPIISFNNKSLDNIGYISANDIVTKSTNNNISQVLFRDDKNTGIDNRINLNRNIDCNDRVINNLNTISAKTIQTINTVDNTSRNLFVDDLNPSTNSNIIKCVRPISFQSNDVSMNLIKTSQNNTNAIALGSTEVVLYKNLNLNNNFITNGGFVNITTSTISNSGLLTTSSINSTTTTTQNLAISNTVDTDIKFRDSSLLKVSTYSTKYNSIFGQYIKDYDIKNLRNIYSTRSYVDEKLWCREITGDESIQITAVLNTKDKLICDNYIDCSTSRNSTNNFNTNSIRANLLWISDNYTNINNGTQLTTTGLKIGDTSVNNTELKKMKISTQNTHTIMYEELTGNIPAPINTASFGEIPKWQHQWTLSNIPFINNSQFQSILSITVFCQKNAVLGNSQFIELQKTNESIIFFSNGSIALKFPTSSGTTSSSNYTNEDYRINIIYTKSI
jgi:hypothetical protein